MNKIFSAIRMSVTLLLCMTLLLGGIYPLAVMGIAQVWFHHKANGSLIQRGDKVLGSSLLGQEFSDPKYFWGRLSAITPPYNAASSGGSNIGPANPKLLEAANIRMAALQQADPKNKMRIPVELITSSASGLDPHLSVTAVEYQVARVAAARKMKESDVQLLVDQYKELPGFGLLGDPYINVLRLNLALDEKMAGDK